MTDPTPSVSDTLLDDFGRNCRADGYAHVENTPGTRRAREAIRAHIADLQRELAEAREWSAELSDLLDAAKLERDQAESALAAARRDAERYRWLRDDVALEALFDELPNGDGATFKQGEELDAAIDAAMGATHG